MFHLHRDERGQSLVIVLSLITIMFLLGSSLAVHTSVALRATRASDSQGDQFHAADGGVELGIWWQRNAKAGNPPSQTINGVSTSITVSIGSSPCPPGAPTPSWLAGFEHGVASASGGGLFDIVTSNGPTLPSVTSTAARSGGYGLQVHTTSTSNQSHVSKSTAGSTLIARFAFKFTSLPAASGTSNADLMLLTASAGNSLYLTYKPTTGKFALRIGAGTPVEAATTVSAGTWYGFDLRYNVGVNPRRAEWQVDGVAQPDVTSAEATASNVTTIQLGATYSGILIPGNTYYDDVLVSSVSGDYPIGDIHVSGIVPDGTGTHSTPGNFQNNDGSAIGATSAGRLDEIPMDTTGDYVKQVTTSSTSYVELTFTDTTRRCINSAFAVAALNSAGLPSNHGRFSIIAASWQSTPFDGDQSETALLYKSGLVSTGGSSWSQGVLNGLVARVGYSTDATPNPYWQALLVEYAWKQPPPDPVTISATAGASTVTTTYLDAGAGVPTLETWTATQ